MVGKELVRCQQPPLLRVDSEQGFLGIVETYGVNRIDRIVGAQVHPVI